MDPSNVILTVQKITPGKTDEVREFYREYQENEEEYHGLLREGGISIESAFIEEREDGDYLYYYFEAEEPEAMMRQWREEDKWMNREFIEDAIEGGIEAYHADWAESILHVQVPDED
jgi:L-rhamnose mutarotase